MATAAQVGSRFMDTPGSTQHGTPRKGRDEQDMDGGNGPPAWVDGAQDLSPEPFWDTKVLESEKNGL